MIIRFEDELKKKYGDPMPMDLEGIPQPDNLALAKEIPAVRAWMVKNEGISVILAVRNEIRNQDDALDVSYIGLEMMDLYLTEHQAIDKDSFKDL